MVEARGGRKGRIACRNMNNAVIVQYSFLMYFIRKVFRRRRIVYFILETFLDIENGGIMNTSLPAALH